MARSFGAKTASLLGVLLIFSILVIEQQHPELKAKISSHVDWAKSDRPSTCVGAPWPMNIFQTGSSAMTVQWEKQVSTWTTMNPGWTYQFLSDSQCTKFVDKHFQDQPNIHNFWHELNATSLRADLIRYLTMLAEGGVYSDMDTSCLKPIVKWIPSECGEKDVRVVAGIEYDDNTYLMFSRPISLCQWTLMAKPGHPVFQKVVARVIYHLEYLARIKHVELGELKLNEKEVLDATGPGTFTDSVMEVIGDFEGRRVAWKELSELKQPKLYGDVLIVPINAFGGGQKHSHSGNPEYGPALVEHHFGRSWYTPGKATDHPLSDSKKVDGKVDDSRAALKPGKEKAPKKEAEGHVHESKPS